MPWSVPVKYVCPTCGAIFRSRHYKRPDRCPACRKAHISKRALANYHRRRAEGLDTSQKKRDRAYDDVHKGKAESVYSSQCVIHIEREVSECHSCHRVKPLINHYCDPCRANGANEAQCMNPSSIRAKRHD